jgi:hypothetical protein
VGALIVIPRHPAARASDTPWVVTLGIECNIVFADGFAGAIKEPGRAKFRPTGLASEPMERSISMMIRTAESDESPIRARAMRSTPPRQPSNPNPAPTPLQHCRKASQTTHSTFGEQGFELHACAVFLVAQLN